MFWSIITALIAGVALLNARALLDFITRIIIQPYFSPLRDLKGPPSPSWFFGHMKLMQEHGVINCHEKWVEEYGPVFRPKGFFNSDRLFVMDTRAIGHVLSHVHDYQKPEQVRYNLGRLMAAGMSLIRCQNSHTDVYLPTASHHGLSTHSPAFGPTQIRALTPIFVDKSLQV
ncbi:hypothetical protein FA95DRAFT_1550876, partial [Auriscalpium vulgare]